MEYPEMHYRSGVVIEECNQIETYLKAIIEAYIAPREDREKFFRSHVLNNSIMPFSAKVKLVIAINRELKIVTLKSHSLHKIMQLRNAFAHNDFIAGIRVDLTKPEEDPESVTFGLESITGSGELEYITRDKAFQEFKETHKSVEKTLKKMLGILRT